MGCAGPPPTADFAVTTLVTTIRVVASVEEEVGGDVVGEFGKIRLDCVLEVEPTWMVSGAVFVERTVEGLFTTTVDGPAGEKEKDVGVVTMGGNDTGDCQLKAKGRRADTMLPVLLPAIVGDVTIAAKSPFDQSS